MSLEVFVNFSIFVQFEEFTADFKGDNLSIGQFGWKAARAKFTAFFNDLHNVGYQTTINRNDKTTRSIEFNSCENGFWVKSFYKR